MVRSLIYVACAVGISALAFLPSARSAEQTGPAQIDGQQTPPAPPPADPRSAPLASTPALPGREAARSNDPQKQCVKAGEFAVELKSGRNPVGGTIVFATNFLPTNQRVDVGVRAPFVRAIVQGAELGRVCQVHLEVDSSGEIAVGGAVHEVGRGYIEL